MDTAIRGSVAYLLRLLFAHCAFLDLWIFKCMLKLKVNPTFCSGSKMFGLD